MVFLTDHENVQQLLNSIFWELGTRMLNDMPYLVAVVYEMLRLYPPVSQLINRVTTGPAVLANETDRGVWRTDAMAFIRERWDDNMKDIKAKYRREQTNFATLETNVALFELVMRIQWTVDPEYLLKLTPASHSRSLELSVANPRT
ncbi:sporulation-specific n-formyltyrosine oxidase [Fusarium sporotrichioides]|uniref:Sporulation-specific n-formyltyrosine oxidase n=1 Tax=Fusarium sporotrichioides TaxID=5514 RepID=A0A395RUX1_FUSSP|nr:sporulation-specific n-formyltyrosine oxidase [Fusarium sporotrichioides]